ncbi:MAG: GumC family protein [Beijerinckiaceae bacterium]
MQGIGAALRRRKWSIILPTFIMGAAAVAFVNLVTPKYAGDARVLLENRVNYLNRPDRAERDQQANAFDSEGVQSQVQVVMSNDLAREAIKRLKLVGNSEFDPQASQYPILNALMAMLGLSKDLTDRSVEDRVMQNYYEKLVVYPVGRSRVVGIEFTSKNPVLAADAANTIAELYLETVSSAKKDLARSASTWLSSNIDELRKRVQEAEARAEEYRARTGLFAAGRDTTLPQQQLAEASTQLTQARTQHADATAKAQQLREMIRNGRVFEISEVSNNELIRRLIEQRVTLRGQLALESRTLLGGHPRIKELNAQIADVEGQIRSAAERTMRGMENDARVAGARVEQLQESLDLQKRNSSALQESEVQLRAYEREAKTLREQLESYLAKYREAIARDTENAEPADARIISRAIVPPRPSFPKKLPIIALTMLAVLLLTMALAIVRELMATQPVDAVMPVNALHDFDQLESPATASGTVEPLNVASVPPRVAAPSIRAASAETHPGTPRGEHPIIGMIDSERNEEGKVRLLVLGAERVDGGPAIHHMARSLSAAGETILLPLGLSIDGNADDSDRPGLVELLAGEASFAEIIHREADSALHVMMLGQGSLRDIAGNSQQADLAFDALDGTYASVIIETSASLDQLALDFLIKHTDVAIIVARGSDVDPESTQLFHKVSALMNREPLIMLLSDGEEAEAVA